jgi:hypothetical protein
VQVRSRFAAVALAAMSPAGAGVVTGLPAQAVVAPTASIYQYCLWNPPVADFTTSVRAFGTSSVNAGLSVYLDGVKMAVFYAPRPGWWLSTVPAGRHGYEVRNYAGTVTLAAMNPVVGGSCVPA